MKKTITITILLAIAILAVPITAIAHIETWAEFDQRLEKQISEAQDKLPIIEGDDDDPFQLVITKIEKKDHVIITTMETKGEFGWFSIAKEIGGIKKFKAQQQILMVKNDLMISGLLLSRHYTLRRIYVDNGKIVCTVDVSKIIINSMIMDWETLGEIKYVPSPIKVDLIKKFGEFERYLKDGGYPPVHLTPEELYQYDQYKKYFSKEVFE